MSNLADVEANTLSMLKRTPAVHSGRLIAVNGRFSCYAIPSGVIRVMDRETNTLGLLRGHTREAVDIHLLADERDGYLVGSVANDGKVFVWQLRPGESAVESELIFSATGDAARAGQNDRIALCSLVGSGLVTAILGGKVLAWEDAWDGVDAADAVPRQTRTDIVPRHILTRLSGAPTALDVRPSPCGTALAIACGAADGTVCVETYFQGEGFITDPYHGPRLDADVGGVSTLAFIDSLHLLVLGSANHEVKLWTLPQHDPPTCMHSLRVPGDALILAALERDARVLVLVTSAGDAALAGTSHALTLQMISIPPSNNSPHQDSTSTAPSGKPPPAQPPPHRHRHWKHSPTARQPHSNCAPPLLNSPACSPPLPSCTPLTPPVSPC